MTIKAATLTTITLAVIALVCACGPRPPATPPEPPPPPVDEDIADLAPAGHRQVVRVDLEKLRSSRLWTVAQALENNEQLQKLKTDTGIDPMLEIDEVIVIGSDHPPGEPDEFLAIIKGNFDAKNVITTVINSGNASSGGVAGHSGAVRQNALMVAVTGRTLLLGTEPTVAASLALADRQGQSIEDDPLFGSIALAPHEAGLVKYRRGDTPPNLGMLARSPLGSWKWLERASSLDASLSVSEDLELSASMIMDSERDAALARKDISRTARRFSKNGFMMLLGLARFLTPIQVYGESTSVEIDYTLTSEDMSELVKLAERLQKIRELLGGGDDAEEDGEGPIKLDPPLIKHKSRLRPAEPVSKPRKLEVAR